MTERNITLADVIEVEELSWNNSEGYPCDLKAGFRLYDGRFCYWTLDLKRRPGEMCFYTAYALGAF